MFGVGEAACSCAKSIGNTGKAASSCVKSIANTGEAARLRADEKSLASKKTTHARGESSLPM